MPPPTKAELLAMAKQQLKLPADAQDGRVPPAYLEELTSHARMYPYDLNFTIAAEPNTGYGQLQCLDDACKGAVISLDPQPRLADGGKKEGIGALAPYRYHVAQSTHKISASRQARVKAACEPMNRGSAAGPLSRPAPMVKQESNPGLLDFLDGSSSPIPSSGNSTQANRPHPAKMHSSLTRIKDEPQDEPFTAPEQGLRSLLPKKRTSDGYQAPNLGLENRGSNPKIAKVIPGAAAAQPKRPLGPTNSLDSIDRRSEAPPDAEQIRWDVTELQRMISDQQRYIQAIERKRKKTAADYTRLARHQKELTNLMARKAQKMALLPSMPQLPPAPQPAPTRELKAESSGLPSIFSVPAGPAKTEPLNSQARRDLLDHDIFGGTGGGVHGGYGDEDEFEELEDGENVATAIANQFVGNAIPHIPGVNDDAMDDEGNFYGRGRDTFQGPRARVDDIDQFLMQAGNAAQFDGNASVNEALKKLGLPSIYTPLRGVEVALMPHQAIGVAWMVEKEKSPLKGGCLGDDMGLGKTVQMISLMTVNRSKDKICKTTLILAPTALLDQWKLEIELKTNDALTCVIYHGSSKPRTKKELLKYDVVLTTYSTMALEWPDYEAEFKAKAKAAGKKKSGDDFIVPSDSESDAPRGKSKKKTKGLLFQVDFYRIVLDESQAVRNKKTRTSRAVTELSAEYRWCLTGTPLVNGLADAYGMIRFLRIRPWYDFTEFHGHVGKLEKKNPTLAVARLQAMFNTFLLRRLKTSMLDGKKLIDLPEKKTELHKLAFSDEEKEIYQMVEAKSQAKFNRYLRAGTVLKNYTHVLVLLLRLRQICSHPSLIQEDVSAFIDPEDDDENWAPEAREELLRARTELGPGFIKHMKAHFKEKALRRMEAEKQSEDATVDDEDCAVCMDALTDAVVTPCRHLFCRGCIDDIFNTPAPEPANDDGQPKLKANERNCPMCRSAISKNIVFSRSAFEPTDAELNGNDEEEMEDFTSALRKAKRGRKGKGKKSRRAATESEDEGDDVMDVDDDSEDEDDDGEDLDDFIVNDNEGEDDEEASPAIKRPTRPRAAKRKALVTSDDEEEEEDEIEKNNVINLVDDDKTDDGHKSDATMHDADDIEEDEEEEEEEKLVILGWKKTNVPFGKIKLMPKFLPSTKMKWMMERIQELAKTRPEEKTLVVSQWTGCLELVSAYLTEKGIAHVKYQGDMSRPKLEDAVRIFMSKERAKVMLMSLKCGGVGLNLTRANNVISLDLGWSQAVEAQAFDRVHRLGQTRQVEVNRLVIQDTVEDRVLAMQERKQTLADGSLGEGKGTKIGRMSVRELANLFGLDHRGRLLEN